MDNRTKFQQVIDVLKGKGYTEDQIAQFTAELTKTGFANLYTEAMALFTEEDMKAIEACATQEEANEKIKALYTLRTGKDAEAEMQKFLDTFSQGFLDQYEKEKSQPTA